MSNSPCEVQQTGYSAATLGEQPFRELLERHGWDEFVFETSGNACKGGAAGVGAVEFPRTRQPTMAFLPATPFHPTDRWDTGR
jgi:hypothetical protein